MILFFVIIQLVFIFPLNEAARVLKLNQVVSLRRSSTVTSHTHAHTWTRRCSPHRALPLQAAAAARSLRDNQVNEISGLAAAVYSPLSVLGASRGNYRILICSCWKYTGEQLYSFTAPFLGLPECFLWLEDRV